jgi:hypothetical protein
MAAAAGRMAETPVNPRNSSLERVAIKKNALD